QRRPKALHMDGQSRQNHRSRQKRAPSVRFDPLADVVIQNSVSTMEILPFTECKWPAFEGEFPLSALASKEFPSLGRVSGEAVAASLVRSLGSRFYIDRYKAAKGSR
ncbi:MULTISPECIES: hypothetical protein, partial [unclassified Bradyrhizobium]|uniref:hypothetical protein n=1 Tax=unclassified Bradyrhizobium TaxID=2631580 RepID=UPI001FFAE335